MPVMLPRSAALLEAEDEPAAELVAAPTGATRQGCPPCDPSHVHVVEAAHVDISCCHIANGCGVFYHRSGTAAIVQMYKLG